MSGRSPGVYKYRLRWAPLVQHGRDIPDGAADIALLVEVEQPNKPPIGIENFQRSVVGGFCQRQLYDDGGVVVEGIGEGPDRFLLICSNWQKQGVGGVSISLVHIVHGISFHD